MIRIKPVYVLLVFLAFMACDANRVYERNQSVDVAGWSYEQVLEFSVHIPDTATVYNIFLNARHTSQYAYSNLWAQLITVLPDSTILTDKFQVELAEPDGRWTGNCLDDICYNSLLIRQNVTFPQTGLYTFRLVQDMRQNPLPGLLDIGLRVERL